MTARSLEELLAVDDPAWPVVEQMARTTPGRVSVLPVEHAAGERVLHRLQVGADTTYGAMALGCGGMLLDHGWLRLLGGGSEHLPDLASSAGVVAHDVLGGRYALDRDVARQPGDLSYWAPDSLSWEPLDMGYSAFVSWVLEVGTDAFYRDWRWPGWEAEVSALSPVQGLALDPPAWTVEGRDLARVQRRAVPMAALVSSLEHAARTRGP